jgi:hypothetical protein
MADYVDELLAIEGDADGDADEMIEGLVEVGALTEIGAKALRKAISKTGMAAGIRRPIVARGLPSPQFARSARETERRAPSGFKEDGTGAFFFTLAAAIGATTVMRSKVSRVAHVDRLLIVPSAPGVVIASLQVGDEEQVLSAGCPVELFSAAALTDTLPDNFSPLGPALDLVVTLQNTTAVAITGTIGFKAGVKR